MTVASNTLSYLCWHFYVYVVTPFINVLIIIHMIVSTEIPPIIANIKCLAGLMCCWLKNMENTLLNSYKFLVINSYSFIITRKIHKLWTSWFLIIYFISFYLITVHLMMLTVTHIIQHWMCGWWWIMNLKGCGTKQPWPNIRHLPWHLHEGIYKNHRKPQSAQIIS